MEYISAELLKSWFYVTEYRTYSKRTVPLTYIHPSCLYGTTRENSIPYIYPPYMYIRNLSTVRYGSKMYDTLSQVCFDVTVQFGFYPTISGLMSKSFDHCGEKIQNIMISEIRIDSTKYKNDDGDNENIHHYLLSVSSIPDVTAIG